MNDKHAATELQAPALAAAHKPTKAQLDQLQLEKDHADGVGGSYVIDPKTRKPVSVERGRVAEVQDESPNAHRRPPAQLVDAAGNPVHETPIVG